MTQPFGKSITSFTIKERFPNAVNYAEALLRKHREELGFIPTAAFEKYNDQGLLLVGVLNNDPCGYVLFSRPMAMKTTVIFQAVIPYDARRRLYGAMLVSRVMQLSQANHASAISCKCAFDLEANTFWESIGWHCEGQVYGGIKRARLLNVWRINLMHPLFDLVAPSVQGHKSQRLYESQRRTGKLLIPFGGGNGFGLSAPSAASRQPSTSRGRCQRTMSTPS